MDADLRSIALSLALFSATATADELSSRGLREIGAVRHTSHRIALKIGVGGVYLGMNHAVRKKKRGVRWVVRYAVPAGFAAAAVHNQLQKERGGR